MCGMEKGVNFTQAKYFFFLFFCGGGAVVS